jgi:uncharacterized membrane protein YcaP (DUF421 family)
MRIMGKRQLGELQPAELVVAVLISDLAAHPLQDIGTPLMYGLIPVLTLVFCEAVISASMLKSVRLRALVCGKPSFIIEDGRLSQSEMRKNRYSIDELYEQLRKKDITDIATVKYAILETDGSLSTVLYAAESPVTPKQQGLSVTEHEYPVVVISDGRVLRENMKKLGYDGAWLARELKSRRAEPSSVFLMAADRTGRIYYAPREVSK